MKIWKIIIIITALAVIPGLPAFSAERNVSLSLSNAKVAPGRQVKLSISFLDGGGSSPSALPYMDGLNVRYKTTFVNGGVTTHVYTVAALKAGRYQIGPFTFKEKGDNYVSNSVFLDVAPGAAAAETVRQAASPSEKDIDKRIFLDVLLPKSEVYINELVPVYVKFCSDWLDIINLNIADVPNNRYITDKYVQQNAGFLEKDGERYIVITFRKSFYVSEAGDFTFGPVTTKFTVTRRQEDLLNKNEDFYEKFVGKKGSRDVEMTTGVYTVKVVPLPTKGRPANFKGAIGDFALEVDADPKKVKAGGAVDLIMRITGKGNLRTVRAPDILPRDGVTISEPRIKREEGVVVVSQSVRVDSPSLVALPSVNFSYFDPGKKEYFTIKIELANVAVETAARAAVKPGSGVVPVVPGGKEKQTEGLIASKESPGKLVKDTACVYESGWFMFFQILPLVILIAATAAEGRRKKLAADTAYVLQLRATKAARAGIYKARAYMRAGKPGEFYKEIFRLMQGYLGTRLSKPPDSVTGEVAMLFKGAEQDEVRGKIKEVFTDCYVARYAPARPDKDDMRATLDKVKETLDSLDRMRAL